MNTDLRKKAKNGFEKDFFKLMNKAVFRKTMRNVRKHREIKLLMTERRRNFLASEPNYDTTLETRMNKPVYLGLSILEFSKILIYEFWYNYLKPKYGEKSKLCYMDTDSFILYIKIDHIYEDIEEDVETRFDTSNFELDRPLPKGKNEKVNGLMKDELGGKIMKKFVGL